MSCVTFARMIKFETLNNALILGMLLILIDYSAMVLYNATELLCKTKVCIYPHCVYHREILTDIESSTFFSEQFGGMFGLLDIKKTGPK